MERWGKGKGEMMRQDKEWGERREEEKGKVILISP